MLSLAISRCSQLFPRPDGSVSANCRPLNGWLVVWKVFCFSMYWESSSQLTFIFFRAVETTHQMVIKHGIFTQTLWLMQLTLRWSNIWRAGKWTIEIGDFPIKTSIQFEDFPASHVDDTRGLKTIGPQGSKIAHATWRVINDEMTLAAEAS